MLNKTICFIMVLFSSSLMFTIPRPIKIPLQIKKEINIKDFICNDIFENRIENQTKKETKIEKYKIDKEEKIKKNMLKIITETKENKEYHDFVLTFYGLLKKECGKIDGITASNKKIKQGMVASPKNIPFGTKIFIENNKYIVEDRGSNKYIKINDDGSIRLDVYVPRNSNEDDDEYDERIQSYGVKRVKGYILKE